MTESVCKPHESTPAHLRAPGRLAAPSSEARYANRHACFETVYIISNIDLREQYPNIQQYEPATWKAFLILFFN